MMLKEVCNILALALKVFILCCPGAVSSCVSEANPPPRESSVPAVNPPRGNLSPMGKGTTGSTANNPSKVPAVVQPDAATSIQGRGHSPF